MWSDAWCLALPGLGGLDAIRSAVFPMQYFARTCFERLSSGALYYHQQRSDNLQEPGFSVWEPVLYIGIKYDLRLCKNLL